MNPFLLLNEELWKSAYNKDGLEQMKELLKNEYFKDKINLDVKVDKEWSSSALWVAVFSNKKKHQKKKLLLIKKI